VIVLADGPVIQMPHPTNSMHAADNEGPVVLPDGMQIPMPDHKERSLGRATKFMSKKAWIKSMLGVQMATASYGRLEPVSPPLRLPLSFASFCSNGTTLTETQRETLAVGTQE